MEENSFAYIIKKERKELGLSQIQVSILSGVALSTLRGIEQEKISPNIETLNRILALFNYHVGPVKTER